MWRAKVFGLGILALLALSLIPALTVYAKHTEEDKAAKFIEIAQRAYREATALIDRTRVTGGEVTAAETLNSEGLRLLNQAKGNYTAGNYALASEKAKAAQEKFRDTIEALDIDEAEEEETGRGILMAIDQVFQRIQRLRDVVHDIVTGSVNPTYIDWINGNLTEANQNLLAAKAIIEGKPTNASAAAKLLGEANRNIEEVYKALKLIGDHNMTKHAENFLKGLNNQLQKAQNELAEAKKKGRDTEKLEDLEDKLAEVQLLIDEAKDDLLNGEKKDALEKTKDARDNLHDITKELQKLQHGKP